MGEWVWEGDLVGVPLLVADNTVADAVADGEAEAGGEAVVEVEAEAEVEVEGGLDTEPDFDPAWEAGTPAQQSSNTSAQRAP